MDNTIPEQILNLLTNYPDAVLRVVDTHDRGWIGQVINRNHGLLLCETAEVQLLIDSGAVVPRAGGIGWVLPTSANVAPPTVVHNEPQSAAPVQDAPPTDQTAAPKKGKASA